MTEKEVFSSENVIPNVATEGKKNANVPNLRFKSYEGYWNTYTIKDIANVVGGGTPETAKSNYWNGNIAWFTPTEVGHTKYVLQSERTISALGLQKSAAKLLPNGTILLSTRATVGECSIALQECTTNQGFQSLIPTELTQTEFLYYLIQTKKDYLVKHACGSTFLEISNSEVKELPLFLPSQDEQTKIATFLALIDQRIDTQSKIIEKLQSQMKAISYKFFSQTAIKEQPLKSFFSKGKAGGTPLSTKKEYYGGDIPFLSISDMTAQGKEIFYTEKFLSELGLTNSTAWIVPQNSLIMSMYASVGLVSINKISLTTSQAMFSMVLNNSDDLEYLYYYLSYFKDKKLHRLLETGTQSNINAEMVKEIPIADYGCKNKDIVETLIRYDKKIGIEKDILTAYKKQKAYLLRQMFI